MVSEAGSAKSALPLGHAGCSRSSLGATSTTEQALDLRALFTTHYGSIWRLLRRLGVHRAQLDDASQEVFWVAARRASDIRAGSEHSFLYGVALRVAAQEARKQRASEPLADLEAVPRMADLSPSPEQQVVERQARELLDEVLDALPPELRVVFVLFELEGLEVREIAELQQVPVGTASSRLRRAREEFSTIAKRVRATLATQERQRR
ncbi:MAG TPA: sigma-70 family RNA polymerase sigma factor [Polyangiaceae bacterium]|nr:sigma-70 family RNA polymerase sigma factor [Polyangiaceae bacterium]